MAIITVEIPLPLKAECWQCSEVYSLPAVTAKDIEEMARRSWCCDDCNLADLDEDEEVLTDHG